MPGHEAYVVDALRTPIGRHRGALSGVRPDDLAAIALKAVAARFPDDPAAIDEVYVGCANQAGEDNRNVARMALLLAGLPQSVPGATVNRLCGSGLEAVIQATRALRCGDARVVLAGGVESMSRAPWAFGKPEEMLPSGPPQVFDTALGWRFPNRRMEALFPLESMGQTAENIAAQDGITREQQDAFALESHRKAVAALDAGWFARELVPVTIEGKKGANTIVAVDEGPRRESTLESLAKLKPAFNPAGSVTAGNASTLNDGAAAALLVSEDALRSHGLMPRARVVSVATAGVDPRFMGLGPVPATEKALKTAGIRAADLDAIELNEAFAAQSLGCLKRLDVDPAKVNVHGGAIALGHPLGASGTRILATLLGVLERTKGRYGLATMCIGVGQGIAVVVERV